MKAPKPKAVLISDIHYSVSTLSLADASLRQAIAKADELSVPLIIAGDLHDTKANLRAECIAAIRQTLSTCKTSTYVMIGNHDRVNEKSDKAHALNFLEDLVTIVKSPVTLDLILVPYQHDPEQLKHYLATLPKNSTLIMHQGIQNTSSHYIQDKSALPKEIFADFRVISGHYHTRQDVACGRPRTGAIGLFSYIGNPYTLNFAEASDPEKGFQVLMTDGTLEFIPTNLRKHVVIDCRVEELVYQPNINADDLLLVKLRGPKAELLRVGREGVEGALQRSEFRLDLIPDETGAPMAKTAASAVDKGELLDSIIDSLLNTTEDQKGRIKQLWKGWL